LHSRQNIPQNGTPLGETRSLLVVRLAPSGEVIQALGRSLAVGTRQELQAGIHLDPRHDALVLQNVDKLNPIVRGLVQRLLEHDGTRDVLAQSRSSVQQLPPVAPVLLGVLNADRVETLPGRCVGLIRGKDTLSASGNVLGRRAELILERIGSHGLGLDDSAPGRGGRLCREGALLHAGCRVTVWAGETDERETWSHPRRDDRILVHPSRSRRVDGVRTTDIRRILKALNHTCGGHVPRDRNATRDRHSTYSSASSFLKSV
jgi:hypothetical protein